MPKVFLSPTRRSVEHVNGWILFQMKVQKKTQTDLAEVIGVPSKCVGDRLKGKTPWKFEEVLEVVNYLGGRLGEVL